MSKKNSKANGYYYFIIVGRKDKCLFDLEFMSNKDVKIDDPQYIVQFIAHAGLDNLDRQRWKTPHMYLKIVDTFKDWLVSGFVTASLIRFVLVHANKNEEGIRNFFNDVYELYIKYSMNPFYEEDSCIKSLAFQKKTLLCAKKYLSI